MNTESSIDLSLCEKRYIHELIGETVDEQEENRLNGIFHLYVQYWFDSKLIKTEYFPPEPFSDCESDSDSDSDLVID